MAERLTPRFVLARLALEFVRDRGERGNRVFGHRKGPEGDVVGSSGQMITDPCDGVFGASNRDERLEQRVARIVPQLQVREARLFQIVDVVL
jgi:hypothetical protein